MSSPRLLALSSAFALLCVACATTPPPVASEPAEAESAAPAAPAVQVDSAVVRSESLVGCSVSVSARGDGPLRWTLTEGDRTLASGTVDTVDHSASWDIPVSWGQTADDLRALAERDTVDMQLHVESASGSADRVVRARSPRLPVARVLTAQASRRSRTAADMQLLLGIKNPNLFDLNLGSVQYAVSVGGVEVASDMLVGGRIPPNAESQFELPLAVEAQGPQSKALAAVLAATEVVWTLKARSKVSGLDVPIDLTGQVKLSK